MATEFEEQNLRFTFGDDWQVIKLDDHDFFRKGLMPLQLTKSVDFLGLYQEQSLYFIEVKDYRGSPILLKNAEQTRHGDTLHLQVARKVKDSVACVVGASRTLDKQPWKRFADLARKHRSSVHMVFWLEFDPPRRRGATLRKTQIEQMKAAAVPRTDKLKKSLRWLTRQVIVTNRELDSGTLPDVVVENVGRAGIR